MLSHPVHILKDLTKQCLHLMLYHNEWFQPENMYPCFSRLFHDTSASAVITSGIGRSLGGRLSLFSPQPYDVRGVTECTWGHYRNTNTTKSTVSLRQMHSLIVDAHETIVISQDTNIHRLTQETFISVFHVRSFVIPGWCMKHCG